MKRSTPSYTLDKERKWSGFDIHPTEVIYNLPMDTEDGDGVILDSEPYTGNTNYVQVGSSTNTHTPLQFVYKYLAPDGKYHGKIGPRVNLDNRDLPGLVKLLTERLVKLDSTSP